MIIANISNSAFENRVAFRKNSSGSDVIEAALNELRNIEFDVNDRIYVESLGAKLPFNNGEEAFQFIKNNNIKIEYSELKPDDTHACYSYEDNAIYINKKYKNLKSFSETLMIAEAILHEAGHAKDRDNKSSLQEEFDCLSLNVLAHMFYTNKYSGAFEGQGSSLFTEGVGKYKDLFFKFDLEKKELKNRLREKYGFLPPESPGHFSSDFIRSIAVT